MPARLKWFNDAKGNIRFVADNLPYARPHTLKLSLPLIFETSSKVLRPRTTSGVLSVVIWCRLSKASGAQVGGLNVHMEGLVSDNTLIKTMGRMNNSVNRGRATLLASNSLRVTKRSAGVMKAETYFNHYATCGDLVDVMMNAMSEAEEITANGQPVNSPEEESKSSGFFVVYFEDNSFLQVADVPSPLSNSVKISWGTYSNNKMN